MINPQKIRQALVRLAEFKQREHYTPYAVRQIIANFDNHPLRDAILYFCEFNDPKEYYARIHELRMLCRYRAATDKLSALSGYDVREILRGDTIITDSAWIAMKKHFDEVDKINERD